MVGYIAVCYKFRRICSCKYDDVVLLYKSSELAEMGDRLVTIDMGRKMGGRAVVSLFREQVHI